MRQTSNQPQTLGSNAQGLFSMGAGIQPGGPWVNPTVSVAPEYDGASVYWLLHNLYDPRTLVNPVFTGSDITSYSNRFSTLPYGFNYVEFMVDYLRRAIFAERPGRSDPGDREVYDMFENICDTSRMLGIFYSAMTMLQSKDPVLFRRARQLELDRALPEMQAALMNIPCPKLIVQMNQTFVSLADVTGTAQFQNVGYLVAGGYEQFLALWASVRNRVNGTKWNRVLFDELGVLGDPATGTVGADLMSFFINTSFKSDTTGYAPYVYVNGASDVTQRLQSVGILSSYVQASAVEYFTQTAWGIPGFGTDQSGTLVNSQRQFVPYLCYYDPTTGHDAGLTPATTQAAAIVGSVASPELVTEPDLAANMAHEYNMSYEDNTPPAGWDSVNVSTGALGTGFSLATTNPRYRVSAGYALGSINYTFSANQLAFMNELVSNR